MVKLFIMREYNDCIIAGAAPTDIDIMPMGAALTIAADGGADLLRECGILPDIVIGDMDSIKDGSFSPKTEMLEYPPEKDDTDTLLAAKTGIERGCNRFFMYGCSGRRLDHTIANIQTLKYIAKENCEGYMIGDSENITVIRNSSIRLNVRPGTGVSVFAIGKDAKGVSLSGLKYEVRDAAINDSFPIGVSNEATEAHPDISVSDGSLIILWRCPFIVPEIRRPDSED
jgi:thiamine pyrophosphokinase